MFDSQTSVANIVLDHSECAVVLERYGIDCCGEGARTLAETCAARGLSLERLELDLAVAVRRRTPAAIDASLASTRVLITKAIARHHQYLHRTLPFLRNLSAKVARRHGAREPELLTVAILVDKLSEILAEHLLDEEHHLFPGLLADPVPPGVGELLARMQADHEEVLARLAELREVAEGYAVPAWACGAYRALMSELAVLEADTLEHLHLEEHVLLPRFLPSPD
jgi:regulator of cell morphogenesis and NO signaling